MPPFTDHKRMARCMATAKCRPSRAGVHTHASTHLQVGPVATLVGRPTSHVAESAPRATACSAAWFRSRARAASRLAGSRSHTTSTVPPTYREGQRVMWGRVAGRWAGQRVGGGMRLLAAHARKLAPPIPAPSPSRASATRASFPSPSPAPVPSPSPSLACGIAAPTALATSACSGRTTRDTPGSVSPHSGAPPPTTTTGRSSRPGRMAPTREDS